MSYAAPAEMVSARFLKFAVVGGFAALANFGSRIAFSRLVPYEVAIVLAFVVGITLAFVLSRRFVFEPSVNSVPKQFGWFLAINLAGLVQTFVVAVVLHRFLLPAIGVTSYTEEIAHGIGVLVPVVTSYIGHKSLSYRR